MNSTQADDTVVGRIFLGIARLPTWLLLTAVTFWCVVDHVWLGSYSLAITGDNISVIPHFYAIYANGFPFSDWTPFPAAGTDMIATGYAPLVFRWVYGLFPPLLATQLLTIAPVAAGVLGVYGLCRRVVGLSRGLAVFAGFAYGVVYPTEIFFTMAVIGYAPVTILALGYLLDNKRSANAWLGVVIAGVLISHSSYISRLLPWPAVIFGVWFLLMEKRRNLVDWLIIVVFSAAIMVVRWQDIIALLSYAPLSALPAYRPAATFENEMAAAWGAIQRQIVWGGNYLPSVMLFLFAATFMRADRQWKWPVFFSLSTFVALLYAGSFFKLLMAKMMPFLSAYNFTAITQGVGLFVVIGGALAVQSFGQWGNSASIAASENSSQRRLVPIAVFLVLFAVGAQNVMTRTQYWVSFGNIYQNTQSSVFKKLAKQIQNADMPSRIMSFYMHGTLLNAYGLETIESYHPLLSKRYHEYWWKMTDRWRRMPGWKESFGERDLGNLTSILPMTVGGGGQERSDNRGQWKLSDFVNMNMFSLANGGYVASRDKLVDPELELVAGPSTPWSPLPTIEKIKISLKANFKGREHVYVYKNPKVLPRAFTVDSVRVLDTGEQVLEAIDTAALETLQHTAFIEKGDLPANLDIHAGFASAAVSLTQYEADHLVFNLANSKGRSLLVVTNSYSPYWTAVVDGKETQIIPVDHTFWGLVVPAGAREVVFDYRAPYRRMHLFGSK